jgi:hypothetical protein
MKATDSGIKEASAAAAVKGQMQSTPRPWKLRMLAEGMEEAPAGLTAEQRKRWGELMSERNRPMRENDGSFIIVAGSGDERCRVATANSRVKAKRGMAHTVEDPEGLANAELICRAVNNFDALVEALKQARYQLLFSLPTPNSLPRYERRAWMDKIAALIASVEDGSSVPNGNDSSSASSSPKSTSAAVTPTKGAN